MALWSRVHASIIIMMWPMIQPLVTAYLPASEWAYESSGIDDLRDEGLDGTGIKVCIVDTKTLSI